MEQAYTLLKDLPYANKLTLGEVLGKFGKNLDYWVQKLIKQGEIIVLKKGLYVSKPYLLSFEKNPSLRESYLEYLANILRYPSYLSLEYALSKYGIIPEGVYSLTSVTLKSSRVYNNSLGNFIYKSIKKNLFSNFENKDFEGKRIKMATKEKALFDYLYFRKEGSLDDLRINWDVFTPNEKAIFVQIIKDSEIPKMERILKILKW